MRVDRPGLAWAGLGVLVGVSGCSGDPGAASEQVLGPLRALVTLERNERPVEAGGEPQASAVAHFAKLPPLVDEQALLVATGLEGSPLAAGDCGVQRLEDERNPSGEETVAGWEPFELLDAGDVTLQAEGTPAVGLAPLAFPAINGLRAGVLYATRNRLASPFPAGRSYTLTTTGSSDLDRPVRITARAPQSLSGVTLDGVPMENSHRLTLSSDLHLTWDSENPGDLVVAKLSNDLDGSLVYCAFADDQGSGTLPHTLLGALPTGSGHIVLTRIRALEVTSEEVDLVRIRFEFSLTRPFDLAP